MNAVTKIMIEDLNTQDHGMEFCEPVNPAIIRDVMNHSGAFSPLVSDLVRRVHEGDPEAILKAARNFTAVADELESMRAQYGKVFAWSVPDLEDTKY